MSRSDEQKLADLLRALPPAPEGWVRAATDLPFVDRQIDDILARAQADAAFRAALIADLERALLETGYEPHPQLLDGLRDRLPRHGS
jgi:hypothetical protein